MRLHVFGVLIVVTTFAACDSPSPRFMGKDAEQTVVEVDGSRFSVHRKGDWVQVFRTNAEYLPKLSAVLAKSKIAIQRATNCPIREGSFRGDQAIQHAQLNCSGDLPPLPANIVTNVICSNEENYVVCTPEYY